VSQYIKTRQKDKEWMKVDMILDWNLNRTALYINETYQITMEFYHGTDKFVEGTELDAGYNYANTLVLYTLSPGATSYFKDLKVCTEKCIGGEKLDFVLSGARKLLSNAFILSATVGIMITYL
jgi:hypothetical protein